MKKTYLITGLVVAALVVGFAIFNSVDSSSSESQEQSQNPVLSSEVRIHDWGKIDINAGVVEKEFEIKNEGEGILKLSDVATSCACTTAQLFKDDEQSPIFGMHTKFDYFMEVAPGESAKLKVIFDPAFHGPNGVGAVTRQIFVNSNDPKAKKVVFNLKALVTRE